MFHACLLAEHGWQCLRQFNRVPSADRIVQACPQACSQSLELRVTKFILKPQVGPAIIRAVLYACVDRRLQYSIAH